MYLLLLGAIAVGAGLLLIYYSIRDKKKKEVNAKNWDPKDKGKVIYLFDDDESGFVDPPKGDNLEAKSGPKDDKPSESNKEKKDRGEDNKDNNNDDKKN